MPIDIWIYTWLFQKLIGVSSKVVPLSLDEVSWQLLAPGEKGTYQHIKIWQLHSWTWIPFSTLLASTKSVPVAVVEGEGSGEARCWDSKLHRLTHHLPPTILKFEVMKSKSENLRFRNRVICLSPGNCGLRPWRSHQEGDCRGLGSCQMLPWCCPGIWIQVGLIRF